MCVSPEVLENPEVNNVKVIILTAYSTEDTFSGGLQVCFFLVMFFFSLFL